MGKGEEIEERVPQWRRSKFMESRKSKYTEGNCHKAGAFCNTLNMRRHSGMHYATSSPHLVLSAHSVLRASALSLARPSLEERPPSAVWPHLQAHFVGTGRILPTVCRGHRQPLAPKPRQGVERKQIDCTLGQRSFGEQKHLKNSNCSQDLILRHSNCPWT